MAKRYKPRRNKLKNHDKGYNRHNKNLSHQLKMNRLEVERSRQPQKRSN